MKQIIAKLLSSSMLLVIDDKSFLSLSFDQYPHNSF
nr:MAG TPA: hypothetical protein [Caudoviricetes sp.]